MNGPARIVSMWTGRREVHVTVRGPGDDDLIRRLDGLFKRLLGAGAVHLIVDLHRLTGSDAKVVELLAVTCRRLWTKHGIMEVTGLDVSAFPDVFGIHPDDAASRTMDREASGGA